jgi:hypothetical protein
VDAKAIAAAFLIISRREFSFDMWISFILYT